ncbi:MAG: hypothetical protein JXB35_06500 [Anaerolineae bacterium]|nr:hypothetical protein [Anaerolineae bacterium]
MNGIPNASVFTLENDRAVPHLLARLEAIGQSLAATGKAVALLSFGSVGPERERVDRYSDLDFFVIVERGHKQAFIADLGWMEAVSPVVYAFRNTGDGCKLLFEDGVFCEFAVFDVDELATAVYPEPEIVWRDAGFNPGSLRPQPPASPVRTVEWLVGEALTNLFVGLGRYHRGERLSAARFIQGHAVDRILELAPFIEPEQPARRDVFVAERRFEQRFPGIAAQLPAFVLGYEGSVASARAILAFLDMHFDVNPAMRAAIEALLAED